MRSVQGQESVRLLFRLRTGSAGLSEDKKGCGMVSEKRCVMCDSDCVMCDSRVGEDVAYFLVCSEEFERDWPVLLDLCQSVGAIEWLDEFWRVDEEGKLALRLEKGVEGICNRVTEKVGDYVYWMGRWLQRRKQLLYG